MNRVPLFFKNLFIISLMVLPFFSKAQYQHPLSYYEFIENRERDTLEHLCKLSRHSRHGLITLFVDSTNKPMIGVKFR